MFRGIQHCCGAAVLHSSWPTLPSSKPSSLLPSMGLLAPLGEALPPHLFPTSCVIPSCCSAPLLQMFFLLAPHFCGGPLRTISQTLYPNKKGASPVESLHLWQMGLCIAASWRTWQIQCCWNAAQSFLIGLGVLSFRIWLLCCLCLN